MITNLKELLAALEEEDELPRAELAVSDKRLESYVRHSYVDVDSEGNVYAIEAN